MNAGQFMQEAIAIAHQNIAEGGRPFGAVVVKNGEIIAKAVNLMHIDNDPTAHAELLALRVAGQKLGTTRLDNCIVYASGQPCPMCLAAMRLSGISEIFYAFSNAEGEPYGLSTEAVANELRAPTESQAWALVRHTPPEEAGMTDLYETWWAQQKEQY
ncbi:nucleoside deaminase [Martelella soudanensis]|uniref:nucleoside deaminase n=1 Tax=unclassified Martelella TaxID=2629616 RepID=UPI0015DF32A2|nr:MULTISPECIES: nucleoside deaminase [unclassified Martelella]